MKSQQNLSQTNNSTIFEYNQKRYQHFENKGHCVQQFDVDWSIVYSNIVSVNKFNDELVTNTRLLHARQDDFSTLLRTACFHSCAYILRMRDEYLESKKKKILYQRLRTSCSVAPNIIREVRLLRKEKTRR